jgi:hypothetical protein
MTRRIAALSQMHVYLGRSAACEQTSRVPQRSAPVLCKHTACCSIAGPGQRKVISNIIDGCWRALRVAPSQTRSMWEQTKPFVESQQPWIPSRTVSTQCYSLLPLRLQRLHAILNLENAEASCTHMHNDEAFWLMNSFLFTCPLTPPITASVTLDRERSPLFRAIDKTAAVATAICFPPCASSMLPEEYYIVAQSNDMSRFCL